MEAAVRHFTNKFSILVNHIGVTADIFGYSNNTVDERTCGIFLK